MTVSTSTNAKPAAVSDRPVWLSMKRGWAQKCPCCGKGAMFKSYLKVNDECPSCKEELHHQRADDAPPYFTMTIVLHFIVLGILWVEQAFSPAIWLQLAVWLPLTALASLWTLPRVKGALVAYQWACRMHGFGNAAFEGADLAPTDPLPSTTP